MARTLGSLMTEYLEQMEHIFEGYPGTVTYGEALMDRWGLRDEDFLGEREYDWEIWGRDHDILQAMDAARPDFEGNLDGLRELLKDPARPLSFRLPPGLVDAGDLAHYHRHASSIPEMQPYLKQPRTAWPD